MRVYDNRHNKRFEEYLPVDVQFMDGRRIRIATNLSFGGMRLRRGIEDVMEGDAVGVRFDIPGGLGSFSCEAEVVYDRDGFLGLSFMDLVGHQKHALDQYISKRVEQGWFAVLATS